METYISLLRGINVGSKQIKMAELKTMYEELGFKNVQTYIQSGNVLFQTKKTTPEKLSEKVEKKIKALFGFDVKVLHLTIEDIERIIQENPFKKEAENEERVYVAFLISQPESEERLQKLLALDHSPDKFIVTKNAIYIYCQHYGTTKISNNFFEAKLKLAATTRNWKTTVKLRDLAKDML